MLKLHVLASGSKGNAAIVENSPTGAGILIDCGICKREFFARCDAVGFDPARVEAVLITHEHADHVKGLGVVLRGLAKLGCTPDVHVNGACADTSAAIRDAVRGLNVFPLSAGMPVHAAGMSAIPFATNHDAAASFGFRIEGEAGDAIGYLTDSGIVPEDAHAALRDVRVLALESNHDPEMLEAGPYPYVVKRRIVSASGHLSNGQAAAELARIAGDAGALGARMPETVVAMHISQNNNDYRLPVRTLQVALESADAAAATQVICAFQDRPVSAG